MKKPGLGRFMLGSFAAAAILAGCSVSQPPIGASGAMPQSPAIAMHAERGGSWMLPEAKSEELLYVGASKGVFMFSYPKAKEVGEVEAGSRNARWSVCSDPRNGNVFVADNAVLQEFEHAGTAPIETLTPPTGYANFAGCSVDQTTGNLALPAAKPSNGQGAVVVYFGGQGYGTTYIVPNMEYYYYCAYDTSGNLFVSGWGPHYGTLLAEMPSGGSSFTNISLGQSIGLVTKLQWDGSYLDLNGEGTVYRVSVSGSKGNIAGTVTLTGANIDTPAFWIQKDTAIAAYGGATGYGRKRIGYWRFPSGGDATKTLSGFGKLRYGAAWDATISSLSR